MMTTQRAGEGKSNKKQAKAEKSTSTPDQAKANRVDPGGMAGLQQNFGNRAVQRLLAQRETPGLQGEDRQVDDHVQTDIEQQRGQGEPLKDETQQQMSQRLGEDFSEVRVHADADSHDLSEQLQARAFTTGNDVFFRQGEYNPHSSAGQELLAHELTHVVQQREGKVDLGGDGMQVNEPDDTYEHEADNVAKKVVSPAGPTETSGSMGESRMANSVQRQDAPEEDILEKPIQRQDALEEDILEKPIQRQDAPEEDILEKPIQRQDAPEEDILEKPIQRQDAPEEDILEKPIQRQDEVEEDILQKPVQRREKASGKEADAGRS